MTKKQHPKILLIQQKKIQEWQKNMRLFSYYRYLETHEATKKNLKKMNFAVFSCMLVAFILDHHHQQQQQQNYY